MPADAGLRSAPPARLAAVGRRLLRRLRDGVMVELARPAAAVAPEEPLAFGRSQHQHGQLPHAQALQVCAHDAAEPPVKRGRISQTDRASATRVTEILVRASWVVVDRIKLFRSSRLIIARKFVTVSHTVKVKEVDLYSAFIEVPYTQGARLNLSCGHFAPTPIFFLADLVNYALTIWP